MFDLIIKKKKLSDLFICKSGNSKYTKSYCNMHSGQYEVYTGSTLQKFASLDTYDYDEPNLTFTTDGEYAGTLKVLKGKYNVGGHRKILIKRNSNLDLNYFCTILQPLFYSKVKKGDVPSVNWNEQLSKLLVNVPINEDGSYNLSKQKEIALKYREIEKQKQILLKKIEYLKNAKIEVETNKETHYELFNITDIFTPKGGNGRYTNTYCYENIGNFPIYSSNNSEIFGNINTYDYDGEFLTWSIVGCAGYINKYNGRFSITNNRGILIPTKNFKNVDLGYMKYVLEPIFRKNKKGRIGINGKNEYTTLNPTAIKNIKEKIKIPINQIGDFDIGKQKEIAKKIATIESIKQDLCNKIIELINISIV